jgi:subtilisin family serine protease
LLVAGLALAGGASARTPGASVGERYIVVYETSVDGAAAATTRRERSQGFRARLRYASAVKGFAATLTAEQADRLRADRNVASVTADRVVTASAAVPLAPGESSPPTGVRRMESATSTTARERSSVNVAVIDTGIDLDHPDLNVVAGRNCLTPGASPDDDNGHGTHVAGTIAARNNGFGVVGVAPGTTVVALKVLDAAGSGSLSSVICAIDWVTSTLTDGDAGNDVPVANMSLGATGTPLGGCGATNDPMHQAICTSTAAGATYVVAAGNDGWDFDLAAQPDVPAAYPQVLTVSAVTDTDGRPGALGSTCSGVPDDRYAGYSNFARTAAGAAHTIAAPGSCIRSTMPGGGYGTMSGTSMASPHVAGAVALCLGEAGAQGRCTGLSPAQVIARMRADAQSRSTSDGGYGFTGDPLRPAGTNYFGYLVAGTTLPAISLTAPAGGSTAADPTPTFSGGAGNAAGDAALVDVDVFAGASAGGSPVRALTATRNADTWATTLPDALALPNGTYTARARQLAGNGEEATSAPQTFAVGPPVTQQAVAPSISTFPALPAAPPPAAAPVTAPEVPAAKDAAGLRVQRVRVSAKNRTLEVLAPMSSRATGTIAVTFQAAGTRTRFSETIRAGADHQRIAHTISARQARSATGILTLRYAGDERTRPEEIRLRTGPRSARLAAQRPQLTGGLLVARGTVDARVRGVVGVRLDWSRGGHSRTHDMRARIDHGRWRLGASLPSAILSDIAARDGTLHAYVLFTGYEPRRIRGEMRSIEVLGAP